MMRVACVFLLVTATAAVGDAPQVRLQFYVQNPDQNAAPVAAASVVAKELFMRASGKGYAPGLHQTRFAVFDANGKEISTLTSDITAKPSGTWTYTFRRGFQSTDKPGTWWVTLEVDGQPAASSSIEVLGAK